MEIISGLVGATFAGRLLGKTKKLGCLLRMATVGTLLGMSLITGIVLLENPWVMGVSLVAMGFFVLQILPVSFEFAIELLFPVGEAFIVGLMTLFADFYSIITSLLVSVLLSNADNALPGVLVLLASSFLGFLAHIFVREDLKKSRYERSMNSKQKNSEDIRFDIAQTETDKSRTEASMISGRDLTDDKGPLL